MCDDSSARVSSLLSAREIISRSIHIYHISTEEDLLFVEQYIIPAYFTIVKRWFDELRSASPMEEIGVPFELDSGCIHVIEKSGKIPDPLLACWIDYSQLLPTDEEGLEIWKIVSVEEDWVDTWFAPKGMLPALDEFAERYLEHDLT